MIYLASAKHGGPRPPRSRKRWELSVNYLRQVLRILTRRR